MIFSHNYFDSEFWLMMLHPHHQHDCHKRGMQFTSATLSWIIRIVFHEQRSAVALSSLLFAHWSAFCCSQQTSSEMSINEARWAFPCTHSHSMCTFRLCTKHFSEASLKMLVVCYPSDSALAAKTKKHMLLIRQKTPHKKSQWALHPNYLQRHWALYQFTFFSQIVG